MKTAALLATATTASATLDFAGVSNNLNIPARPFTELETIARAVNHIEGNTWKAEAPTHRFASTEDVKKLCGTWLKDDPRYQRLPSIHEIDSSFEALVAQTAPPTNFDSRTEWSNCTVISKIRDQSSCGSCWAFGSTETFEDRRCVALGEDKEFASEDTAACCRGFSCGMSQGCNGGQPSAALQWMSHKGIVTGGDYPDMGKGTGCKAYSLAPCAHHVPPSAKYPACPKSEYHTPACKLECDSGYTKNSYEEDKTKSKSAFSVNSVKDIMTELVQGGPLSCAFTVYSDFPTYKSGVYQRTPGTQALGGHAVEIIGYGTEDSTDYWLVKNSWNEEWGDGGTFKILRGTNECGIEDDVAGVRF
jgi:cathepsin B